MTYKNNNNEHLVRVINELADSVLGLSDEAILAEVREAGIDPYAEAERTRSVLRDAFELLEDVHRRLSDLGHTVNPNYWQPRHGGYRNDCLNCGASVSFTTATGEMRGKALHRECPASDQYTIYTREASRK